MQTLENITKIANQFSNQLTTKSDILPSLFNETNVNDQTLGIMGVENPENYPVTYTIKSRSDINGTIQVEITVSQKTISKQTTNNIKNQEEDKKQIISQTKTITISNFKTIRMQNRDDVEEIIKQLNNLETTLNNKLPSDIEYDVLTPQVLGINPISNPKNTEITYSKIAIDDAKGEFKLKIIVKKELYSQEKIIITNKFKTQGQLDDDILGVFDAQIPEEIKTEHDNKLPSEI